MKISTSYNSLDALLGNAFTLMMKKEFDVEGKGFVTGKIYSVSRKVDVGFKETIDRRPGFGSRKGVIVEKWPEFDDNSQFFGVSKKQVYLQPVFREKTVFKFNHRELWNVPTDPPIPSTATNMAFVSVLSSAKRHLVFLLSPPQRPQETDRVGQNVVTRVLSVCNNIL